MTNAAKHALFVYGTLGDPAIQEALFGRRIAGAAAVLYGWAVYRSTSDGFLFVKPRDRESVSGLVLILSDRELEIADAWEDVPLYRRERVSVALDQRVQEVWAYTRRDGLGLRPDDSSVSGQERHQVADWARRMRSNMDAKR